VAIIVPATLHAGLLSDPDPQGRNVVAGRHPRP
jgi:hypothetical protein